MSEPADSIRVLFSSPAYWPALAFGGPIWAARELNGGMVRRGHHVEVLTTTLMDIERGRSSRTTSADVDGALVHYLATPVRYRWMGVTPSVPRWLHRIGRPHVAHVSGFRDPLGTAVAAWCRLRDVPYVFEPLGMFQPRLRKVRVKQAFDTTLRWLVSGAAAVVVTSEHEGREAIACGAREDRVTVRGYGFPPPAAERLRTGALRGQLGLGDEPLILSVGRIASGKGVEMLLETVRRLPEAHLALVGPDDGHGVSAKVAAAQRAPLTAGRIHRLEPAHRPLDLYADADVFVLASAGESFGMVAAEAAAAGTPVVVTDRCGVSEFLEDGGAIVVPYDVDAVHKAVGRVLDDRDLQEQLSATGRVVAASLSWDAIVDRQERIYREAIDRER